MDFLIVKTIFSLRSPSQRGYFRMFLKYPRPTFVYLVGTSSARSTGPPLGHYLFHIVVNFCFLWLFASFAFFSSSFLIFSSSFSCSFSEHECLTGYGILFSLTFDLLLIFFPFILCLFVCESRISLTHCCSFLRIGFHVFN